MHHAELAGKHLHKDGYQDTAITDVRPSMLDDGHRMLKFQLDSSLLYMTGFRFQDGLTGFMRCEIPFIWIGNHQV